MVELLYVRVEYAGQLSLKTTKEQNGFSFYSVGSGTTLENLVSYKVMMMVMNFTVEL
jgi:hypothetical protein